jgi:hypothetical protein
MGDHPAVLQEAPDRAHVACGDHTPTADNGALLVIQDAPIKQVRDERRRHPEVPCQPRDEVDGLFHEVPLTLVMMIIPLYGKRIVTRDRHNG